MAHSKQALERAIQCAGGVAKLARALGIQSQAVSQWRNGTTSISPGRALEIEVATGGAVPRGELRPDIFGEYLPVKRRAKRARK
jgi:DNA-binding transcriptional regulator YdaS (Cro superfamily)